MIHLQGLPPGLSDAGSGTACASGSRTSFDSTNCGSATSNASFVPKNSRSFFPARGPQNRSSSRRGRRPGRRNSRKRCAPLITLLFFFHTTFPRSPFAESANSEGVGGRAEGPNNAGGAAHFVLQRGTCAFVFFCWLRFRLCVLSDRD